MKITQNNRILFKGILLKTCLFALIFIFSFIGFSQTTYTIDDPEEIRDVIYEPGDVIILENGTYTTDERMIFLGSGTAENPVTLRAETPGGVIFTGGPRLTIGGESENGVKIATGEYLVVDGFHWQGGAGASNFIEFRNGSDYANYSTIQNCAIDGLTASDPSVKHRWIVLYGTYNTVINCSFMNKSNAGALILAEYEYNASPDDDVTNTRCNIVGHTISNNYFYKYSKIDPLLTNAGDSETIRIGTSEYQNVNSNATVSNNYFVEADGENEIITNKSKGNTYTNNTFRRCRGSLVLRHGSDATVDGNYFLGEDVDGTGGIRITDSNHTITNNYIQDCITVLDQAKWNNGITFIGGSSSAAVDCNSTSTSNGYQKSENINLSNNTIVNTNAPLFYNEDKGSTDPTGTVSNNLIYFAAGDPNLSDVISGDSPDAFQNLGKALTYSGNVYKGTALGETDTDTDNGFSLENGITATADGEIFTFGGPGSTDKGADMDAYAPTTDAMVGYGIGACFLDNLGASIIDGDCTIVIGEFLTVSGLAPLSPDAGSYDVTVTANVSWTAVSNEGWITIDTNSGSGNATVAVMVSENPDTSSRAGTVTFSQVEGGDDIVRTLTVTQNGADLTDLYNLINDVPGGGPVSIHSFSKEQGPDHPNPKTNYATNTLDKDNGTVWAADDVETIPAGDYFSDGEYIIYDLGSEYELDLIQIATDGKADSYGLQVWVSTTGTDPSDFTLRVLPTSGDLQFTAANTTDYNQYEIIGDVNARYVKLMSFGRFNSAGDDRLSFWTNITEIEFYSAQSLSISDTTKRDIVMYPVPAKDMLHISNLNQSIDGISVYSLDGRKIIEKVISNGRNFSLDTSSFVQGVYIINFMNGNVVNKSKMIVVSK